MHVFDEIKKSVDIKKCIEFYGNKVVRGKFICPFHNDTKPSASIKNDYFHCFVCGAGGDCITYVKMLFGYKKNIDAAKRINNDFCCGIEFGKPLTAIEKLKAKRARENRLLEERKKKNNEILAKRVYALLCGEYKRQKALFRDNADAKTLTKIQVIEQAFEEYEKNPVDFAKYIVKRGYRL